MIVSLPDHFFNRCVAVGSHIRCQNPFSFATFSSEIFRRPRPHHQDRLPLIYPSEETLTSNSDPRAGTRVFFNRRLPHVANFSAMPFTHLGRPSPTSLSSHVVPLFEACNCTFFSLLCPAAVLFWIFLIF